MLNLDDPRREKDRVDDQLHDPEVGSRREEVMNLDLEGVLIGKDLKGTNEIAVFRVGITDDGGRIDGRLP